MNINSKARLLVEYTSTLTSFRYVEPEIPYNHMGATITDAMLQAGVKYETVVKPRVEKIHHNYPEAKTTSGFLKVIERMDLANFLEWHDSEKPRRILEVTRFFAQEGIETEAQLKTWLEENQNIVKLDAVRGVGNKTIDYFRILSGDRTTSAIDIHLLNFLREAGISTNGYLEAREVINSAADLIGKDRSLFDHSIWKYMSEQKERDCSSKARKPTQK